MTTVVAQSTTEQGVDTPAAAARPSWSSTKQLAFRGAIWTVVGYGISQVLRLGSNLILTRLLFPEAFGLMALINVLIQGLTMFSDVGINPSLIQHKRGEEQNFYNTAWTIQVVRGVLLWLAACALAWPMAKFYAQPQLIWMVPVGAFASVLAGWNSTGVCAANRRMQIGRLVIFDLLTQICGLAAMIALAWVYHSVWALVIGSVINAALRAIFSFFLCKDVKNRFHFDSEAAKELFGFGRWIFVSTVITFFALQLDRLMLGRLVPIAVLGVYGVAMTLVQIPQIVALQLSQRMIFPIFSQTVRDDPARLGRQALKTRAILLPAALVMSLGIAFYAPLFFRRLYDVRYADAGWMAQLLSGYIWFSILQASIDRALLALGDTRSLAISNFINVLTTVAGCLIGIRLGGVPGFIIGLAMSSLAGHLTIELCLLKHGIRIVRQDLMFTTAFLAMAAMGVFLPKIIGDVSFGRSITWILPSAIFFLVSAWAAVRLRAIRG